MEFNNDLSMYSYSFLHRESAEQGYVNLRGQGQRSSQGQMTKMTYFSRKWSVTSITANFYIQLGVQHIKYMHTECAKQGYVNFRGQGQWSSQGRVTKVKYFSRFIDSN